jgi:glucose/arabinose dehydrogenase
MRAARSALTRGKRPATPLASVAALLVLGLVLLARGDPSHAQSGIALELVASGLARPVTITHAGDGSGRLFIVQQGGKILIHDGTQVRPTPFLDLASLVSCCGEQGLLGLAFHPQYAGNGLFYVNYTNIAGNTVIARYHISADPNVADPGSAAVLLTIAQPFSNHNGGQLQFGPDGYLYIGMGDGGSAGDPGNRAQNLGELLGKILRIDVNGDPPYAIPPSNPFIGTTGARGEIWALGVRNPWRFSFDRLTGDLFIADVGQSNWEEVNLQAASSPGGENYGWRRMEGTHCFNPSTNCNDGSLTLPVLEYDHSLGCSVTGGYRYRGSRFQSLYGTYVYGDYCSGRIWGAVGGAGGMTSALLLDTALLISTFGEDEDGELYVAHHGAADGAMYRIVIPGKDLVIEDLMVSPASMAAGGTVTVSHDVVNLGTVTVTETYTDRIYLSTDAVLDGADTLLGNSHGHTVDLAPTAAHANTQNVTIPAGTAPGNRFILVRADALGTVNESNEGNNVTAIPVTVTSQAGRDLVIENLTLSAGTVPAGNPVTVSYRVANRGTGTVTAIYTDRIHLSANATLGAGDTLLGSSHGHTADLAPNATHANAQAVTVPVGTTPGNYFILVQADALGTVSEASEGNNVTAIPVTVGPPGTRDLVIEQLALSAGTVPAGKPVTVSHRVANRGTGTVTATYTDRIYLSANATLGAGDTLLGSSHGHTADLAPNATHANAQAVTVPVGTTPGNYFILVQADGLAQVAESNESNNVTAIGLTVRP